MNENLRLVNPLLASILVASAVGIVFGGQGTPAEGSDPEKRAHEIDGPVKILWEVRYDGPVSGEDRASVVAVSPDGSIVLVGGSQDLGSGDLDHAVLAYDAATGRQNWNARHNGPGLNSEDTVSFLAVSPDGATAYVTGTIEEYHLDYATVAYNTLNGEKLWTARHDGPNHTDVPVSVVVSPDNATVFVTGTTSNFLNSDYLTVALDAMTGESLWEVVYDGPGMFFLDADSATSLAVSPDGSKVFVAGFSSGIGSFLDYTTLAYDAATGETIWVSRRDGPASLYDGALSLGVSPCGSRVFVTGYSTGVGSHFDYETVAYDATTGEEVWASRYNGVGSGPDYAQSLAVGPEGSSVFVTGPSASVGGLDYATVAYDAASGEQIWSSRYAGPAAGPNYPSSLSVSREGALVFVVGSSHGVGTDFDYATVAYDAATGEQVWVARFDGQASASDMASSSAVSPNGSVLFVTGTAVFSGTGQDLFTIAYELPLRVSIDIAPGDPFNLVSPCSHSLPVAILGSAEFDIHEIDTRTLRFGPEEAATVHDLNDPFTFRQHVRDVDFDGDLDLVAHFSPRVAGIALGQVSAALSGTMDTGRRMAGTEGISVQACPAATIPSPPIPGG